MIYIHKSSISNDKYVNISKTNLKIIVLDKYEVSIVFDDSCGSLKHLSRVDARVFLLSNDKDLTSEIVGERDFRVLDFKDITFLIEMVEQYDIQLNQH